MIIVWTYDDIYQFQQTVGPVWNWSAGAADVTAAAIPLLAIMGMGT